jgi:hypothetical protein
MRISGDTEGAKTDALSVPVTLELFASSSLTMRDPKGLTRGVRVHDLQVLSGVSGGSKRKGLEYFCYV